MAITWRNLILLMVLLISTVIPGKTVFAEAGDVNNNIAHLQILTVNDFHGALSENGKDPGAAKLVEFLKESRASNPDGTILLSAGDMFEGTADSNLLYGKTVVDVMNNAKFDVMTLGNHEFDWGINILKQRIAQANFPYVCANIIDRSTGKPVDFVKPYVILERDGLKIAVIGIATPETAYKTNPQVVSGFIFQDPVEVVNTMVPEIKMLGVDVIVVLSHLPSWMDENGNITGDAATLAFKARGVDAIVSGHSHQTVYGNVDGIPMVQAYYNGRAVGKIDLAFDKSLHQVTCAIASVTKLPYDGLTADPEVQAILDQAQQEVAPMKNTVVGQAQHELSHDRNRLEETILGQWVTDVMRQAVGADIAFQNSGGLRTGIPAGTITMGNLYEVMPFDNTMFTVDMTGKQVMMVLEYGIMNDKIGMVQYSGLKVAYNPSAPEGERITSVTLADGTALNLDKVYKVVTNDFMASGGDGFTVFKEGKNLHDTCIPLRDVIADTIRKQKVIDFTGDDRWNLLSSSLEIHQIAA